MHDSALIRFYHSYLESQDSASFITAIAARYGTATLAALAQRGDVIERRSAVLALGYVGDFSVNSVLGKALRDEDRGVRLIAESGIGNLWMSFGSVPQRRQLEMADRLIAADELQSARAIVHGVLDSLPTFAEASRLLGVANFASGRIRVARANFRQAIIDNPYQYQAAIGLGNCGARLQDAAGAVRWFRRALRINPELEMIRLHVAQLTQSPDQP
jgi:tetratricopeptide (TPR) repeat protein